MGKKSYQGQDQDITLLAGEIETALLDHGMLPGGSGWDPFNALAQGLAAHANANQESFRARLRGE